MTTAPYMPPGEERCASPRCKRPCARMAPYEPGRKVTDHSNGWGWSELSCEHYVRPGAWQRPAKTAPQPHVHDCPEGLK